MGRGWSSCCTRPVEYSHSWMGAFFIDGLPIQKPLHVLVDPMTHPMVENPRVGGARSVHAGGGEKYIEG